MKPEMETERDMNDGNKQKLAALEKQWRTAVCRMAASPREKRAAIRLLRELARGEPVDRANLAHALEVMPNEVEGFLRESELDRMIYWDQERRVAGFWGLSTMPTCHQLAFEGRRLWSWCAQDSLFLSALLGEAAEVESTDPESGERVRLTVSSERVVSADPESVVVSMVRPDVVDTTSAARIISTACHLIFFFASERSGERWTTRHPGTTVLSLEEAFALGKLQNGWLLESSDTRAESRSRRRSDSTP